MTITEKNLAEKLKDAYIDNYSYNWATVASTAAELLGVELAPEPTPLPTEPGSAIIATEVRGVKGEWVLVLDCDGCWFSTELISEDQWHHPERITAWTKARVVPGTAAPVTLTEDQVGEVWNANKSLHLNRWAATLGSLRGSITATVNAALAQHAAPAEDMPDWDDVRNAVASQRGNGWSLNDPAINGITDAVMRLLRREEA